MTATPPATDDRESITADELDWVLSRHGGRLQAAELIDEIRANRDSTQYEPGATYQDPEGNHWQFFRSIDDAPGWLRPGLTEPCEYATPRRPLVKLVPAQLTARQGQLIAEMLTEHMDNYQVQATMERIAELLAGGQDR